MAARRPAEVFHPGEFLREELEERGWTQTDLAEILGRPFPLVNEIIAGKRGITPETAAGLAAALGTSAELWLNLDAAYQLAQVERAGKTDHDQVARRARLYSAAPIKEMVRRGWVEASDNVQVMERRVMQFLEVDDLDETPRFAVAARKSTSYDDSLTPSQRAWLCRARHLARRMRVAPFSPERQDWALRQLRELRHAPSEIRRIPNILTEAGIRFVVVQPLTGSKIDGACFWLDDASPVIVISVRFDRIDNFWFVLLHELTHVKNGDGISVDSELEASLDSEELPAAEREANRFASDFLVPAGQLDNFVARVRPLYSTAKIEGFARTLHVHPGLVVGQLQHRKEIAFSSFRSLLVRIRDAVTQAALTDGWGTTVSAAT
jgi:HTH-type transcriptional regulator/antitoxin HigA